VHDSAENTKVMFLEEKLKIRRMTKLSFFRDHFETD
jgi:hypothetical protein